MKITFWKVCRGPWGRRFKSSHAPKKVLRRE
jgi:hypothetical protein